MHQYLPSQYFYSFFSKIGKQHPFIRVQSDNFFFGKIACLISCLSGHCRDRLRYWTLMFFYQKTNKVQHLSLEMFRHLFELLQNELFRHDYVNR